MSYRGECGSAVVELALVVPLLVLLVVGAVDFARVFYTAMSLSNAARAGAQYGAISTTNSTDTAGIAAAATVAGGDIALTSANVTSGRTCECGTASTIGSPMASCPPTGTCIGTVRMTVNVTASKTFNTFFRFRGVPSTVALSRTVSMRAQ